MAGYRALHCCLPSDDNLGDALACLVVPLNFGGHGIDLEIDQVDLRALRSSSTFLDERLDQINAEYDMKCDALMEMIVDFPHRYLCHVDELGRSGVPETINRILSNTNQDHAAIRMAQDLLKAKLASEHLRFMAKLSEILRS